MGKNKVNVATKQDREEALVRDRDIYKKASQDSPELLSWRKDKGNWDSWLANKDFSKGPEGSILNFDLWNPAHIAQQTAQMANLEGVGAAGLGGDNSIALQQSRERNANEAAQNAGASYENAVAGQDAFFKGGNFDYMNAENNKWGNMFGQSSANRANATNTWIREGQRPEWWQKALGGGLQLAKFIPGLGQVAGAASSIFGGK